MFKRLIRWFTGPSPEEAYQDGRNCAEKYMRNAADKNAMADELFDKASGGFNTKPQHFAFDRGVIDYLNDMGYDTPY